MLKYSLSEAPTSINVSVPTKQPAIARSTAPASNEEMSDGLDGRRLPQEQPQGLCHLCRGINFETLTGEGGYQHADSYWALKESAAHCALCWLLDWSRWYNTDFDPSPSTRQVTLSIKSQRISSSTESPYLSVDIPEFKGSGIWSRFPLNTEVGTLYVSILLPLGSFRC